MSQEFCRLFHVLAIGSNQIKSNQSLKFTWVITNSWIFNTSVKSSNTSVTFRSKKITGNNCWLLSDWINSNLWNDWSLNEFLKGSAHLLQVWAKFSEIYQMDRFFNQMPPMKTKTWLEIDANLNRFVPSKILRRCLAYFQTPNFGNFLKGLKFMPQNIF